MKNYLLLFKGGLGEDNSAEDWQNQMMEWKNWMDELGKNGRLNGGEQLKQSGRVMMKENNKIIDKPYADAKEIIGGYLIIKADGQEEAIELAKACPIFNTNGTCEIAEIIQN